MDIQRIFYRPSRSTRTVCIYCPFSIEHEYTSGVALSSALNLFVIQHRQLNETFAIIFQNILHKSIFFPVNNNIGYHLKITIKKYIFAPILRKFSGWENLIST